MSDALDMKAICEILPPTEAVKRAYFAGNDIILMPIVMKSKEDFEALDSIYTYIINNVREEKISEKEIDNSVACILELKEKYCKNPKR